MNILMVLSSGKYPPDRRVEREARDLIRDGHRVFLMARRGPGQAAEDNHNGVHVIRVPLPFQDRQPWGDLAYYCFQRYSIIFRIMRACRKYGIEALHVHDLPYAFATALAGRILNIPVVFDMHEHYTVMLQMGFEAASYRKFKAFSFALLGLLRMEERAACRWSRKVIVVAHEHIPRIRSLGVPPERIIEVTNTEDMDYFAGLSIDQTLVDRYANDFPILYVGGFSPHRGLETAIQAMPRILEHIPNAKLLLVGDGISRRELEARVRESGLEDSVVFTGFQRFEMLPTYIRLSAVCLIPHISTPHIETTMPNKIFQFMILGKAVLVSSTKPMMRVVEDADCGLVFQERDAGSLGDAVVRMSDEGLRRRLGENGRKAVENRYNWCQTVQPLLDHYRDMAAQHSLSDGSTES